MDNKILLADFRYIIWLKFVFEWKFINLYLFIVT